MSESSDTLLAKRLEAAKAHFSGRFSAAARNLTTGEEILVDPHRQYPTASTFKVPIMVTVFKQIEEGKYKIHDRLTLKE
ncbi:MAG TPA: serine hydrolase, partial [Thermomicrobiales bacterium]|nr:serine hydrolase [Thermomicrobiales bacterium]